MPANGSGPPEAHASSGLFDEHRDVVRPEWIDENGHFNMGYYVVAFDRATDAWLHHIGLTASKRERSGVTTFTLESHVNYLGEVLEAAPLRFTTRLLGFDQKRIHYFHEMYHATEGFLAATNELMSLHVNLETRRGGVMAEDVLARLADILSRHQTLPLPRRSGAGSDSTRGPRFCRVPSMTEARVATDERGHWSLDATNRIRRLRQGRLMDDPERKRPLKPMAFQILLLLGDGERHGWSIVREFQAQAGEGVRILPGSLYRTLNDMTDQGLIEEAHPPRRSTTKTIGGDISA